MEAVALLSHWNTPNNFKFASMVLTGLWQELTFLFCSPELSFLSTACYSFWPGMWGGLPPRWNTLHRGILFCSLLPPSLPPIPFRLQLPHLLATLLSTCTHKRAWDLKPTVSPFVWRRSSVILALLPSSTVWRNQSKDPPFLIYFGSSCQKSLM